MSTRGATENPKLPRSGSSTMTPSMVKVPTPSFIVSPGAAARRASTCGSTQTVPGAGGCETTSA